MTSAREEEQGDNRAAVYWEDIGGELFLIIRASAIGHPCLWELGAAGQGIDAVQLPGNMVRAFNEGKKLEPVIIERLKKEHGYLHDSAQVEGHLILPDNIMVRYHPDGIGGLAMDVVTNFQGRLYSGPWVVEVKALRHEGYETATRGHVGDVIKEYNWQLSVMMIAERLPGMWVAYDKGFPPDPTTGIKPYCEGEGRIWLDPITTPPISLDQIIEKANQIKEVVLGEDLLVSDRPCDSPDHFPCRYLHIRPEPEGEETDMTRTMKVDSDTVFGEELDQAIRDYLLFKGQADEAKQRADALKEWIVSQAAPDVSRIATDKFVVPLRQNTNSKVRWDLMTSKEKAEFSAFVEKKKTARFIQGVKGLG